MLFKLFVDLTRLELYSMQYKTPHYVVFCS